MKNLDIFGLPEPEKKEKPKEETTGKKKPVTVFGDIVPEKKEE